MSVTNDAEAVVEFVLQQNNWNQDIRILYEDSEGSWDELQHDGSGFLAFRIWNAASWQDIVCHPDFDEGK